MTPVRATDSSANAAAGTAGQNYGDAITTALTAALYKTQHLEVFRLVLLAGKEMPEHRVVGELTVQCLEGSVEFSIGSTRDVMRAGDLKCLAGGVLHWLRAIEDASVLVTLLLHGNRVDA